MGLRTLLRDWLIAPDRPRPSDLRAAIASNMTSPIDEDGRDATRITINKAVNGHVIQIGKFRPNPHGPDWTYELYLVPDGTDMVDSIRTCITLGALNK